jgi:hypothetical protein
VDQILFALPEERLLKDSAVIADAIPRDLARAPGAVEMFGESLVGLLGLGVIVGTD